MTKQEPSYPLVLFLLQFGPLLFPIFLTVVVRALIKKNWAIVLFCSPALFSLAIYSVAAHNESRYSEPLIPLLIVVMVVAMMGAFKKWGGGLSGYRGRTKQGTSEPA